MALATSGRTLETVLAESSARRSELGQERRIVTHRNEMISVLWSVAHCPDFVQIEQVGRHFVGEGGTRCFGSCRGCRLDIARREYRLGPVGTKDATSNSHGFLHLEASHVLRFWYFWRDGSYGRYILGKM